MKNNFNICVIGLGYVGLPLALELGKHFKTTGFDINERRIDELKNFIDVTNEVNKQDFIDSKLIQFSKQTSDLHQCNVYIVTVPTPINQYNKPELSLLENASKLIAKYINQGDLVIYESTVYPGVTEDFCGRIIEEETGLKSGIDFNLGYSPERINPGDKSRRLCDITKIISADNKDALEKMENIYGKIIKAGIYNAENIKTAEAAKVIENTQRDVNIGLINEFSIIFNKLGLNTHSVLKAASTKWNFINFKPGLVGGHCIGVDPYYLAHVAEMNGVDAKVILSSRETNDNMSLYCAEKLDNEFKQRKIAKKNILIFGATFKEDCPDFRNTKVTDLYIHLQKLGYDVSIYDPDIDNILFFEEYGIKLLRKIEGKYGGVILAVPHKEFVKLGKGFFKSLLMANGIFFDLKSAFKKDLDMLSL